jgi:anti-sigma factor RsiW
MSLLLRRSLSCQELVELLTDYLDGALSWSRGKAVDAHLAGCADCTAYLEQFRATIALTGRLRVEDVEPAAMDELLDRFRDWAS